MFKEAGLSPPLPQLLLSLMVLRSQCLPDRGAILTILLEGLLVEATEEPKDSLFLLP